MKTVLFLTAAAAVIAVCAWIWPNDHRDDENDDLHGVGGAG